MLKIEHVGIAVHDLKASETMYKRLLGVASYKREEVSSESVTTSFFKVGPNKVELLATADPASAIGKHLARRGEGIHHIAYGVEDIRAEMARLKSEGFELLSDEPKLGADNKLVCFVHPKTAGGVLVELCQEIPHQ